jgi:hypothetical protein
MIHSVSYYSRRHGKGKDIILLDIESFQAKTGCLLPAELVPSGLPTSLVTIEHESKVEKPHGKDFLWAIVHPADKRRLRRMFATSSKTVLDNGNIAYLVKSHNASKLKQCDWIVELWHCKPKMQQMS